MKPKEIRCGFSAARPVLTDGVCSPCVRGMPSHALLDSMNGLYLPSVIELAISRRTPLEPKIPGGSSRAPSNSPCPTDAPSGEATRFRGSGSRTLTSIENSNGT